MPMPSQDQVMAQLRILIPALGTVSTLLGVKATTANQWVDLALTIAGPVMILGGVIWSLFANTRESIMKSAAKPVEPGVEPPKIILPREEADLAQKLPENVTSK